MLDKLRKLRTDHLKIQHDLEFYPYQEEISDGIIEALLQNFRITSNASPEEIKKLTQIELGYEISRQGGKTYAVGHTGSFLMTFIPRMFNRPIKIGIFAAQLNQSQISYNILRTSLRQAKALMKMSEEEKKFVAEQENARQLVLPDGSSVVTAPISKISQIEGLTLDLIIIDEAQLADDEIVDHSIRPMGKTTNAPIIRIGKAGTKICTFYRMGQMGKTKKYPFEIVAAQRRELYQKTGDARHLIYEQSVRSDIIEYGEDSDYIQREYFLKWQIGTGQYIVEEDLDVLYSERNPAYHHKEMKCYAGIDTAKNPDSTVVTILRYNTEIKKKEVLNWLELRGDNYKDQFDIIHQFLKNYNIVSIAIDSTGQGDFMPDMFERESRWRDEFSGLYRVKFSAVSKDQIYKNLKVSIKEFLTTLPKLDKKHGEKFRQQMLDLQQEYKGQLLSVHHPDSPDAHDDYCLVAGTQILTDKGQVDIQNIKLGDMVMTRKGYKPVVSVGNRKAKVISKFGITGTPDHPFITTKGIKRFDELTISDKLHIWNEKLSSIEVKSIIDIQKQKIGNTEYITGDTTNIKIHPLHYTGKFILTIMAKFLRGMLFTTSMAIHSIMNQIIFGQKLGAFINHITPQSQNEPKKRENNLTRLETRQGRGTQVKRVLSGIGNMLTNPLSNKNKSQIVYNIEVLDEHEYFANNILVHNCDSWALAEWAYAKYNEDMGANVAVLEIRDDKGRINEDKPAEQKEFDDIGWQRIN